MTSRPRILRLLVLVLAMTGVTMFLTFLPMVAAGPASAGPCNSGGRIVNFFGTVSLSDCTITMNSTSGSGGGVENHDTMILTNVVISNNSADGDGGGIYNAGTMTLINVVVTGNTAAGVGGGIQNDGGTVFMSNVTVTGNGAGTGGGGIANVSGSMIGAAVAVGNNTTTNGDGGGILDMGGSFCLSTGTDLDTCFGPTPSPSGGNSLVTGNIASNGNGGGIANGGGTLTLSNSTVDGNQAEGGDGGGIWNVFGTTQLVNVTISNNTTDGNGGGVLNDVGGSVCCASATNGFATNVTISGNTAGGTGGGVYTVLGLTIFASSTIADNSGVGVYNDDASFGISELLATLLARNNVTNNVANNCGGTIASDGHNLDTGAACAFAGAGDQQNGGDASVGLRSLAPNGGPTQGSSPFTTQQGDTIAGLSAPMKTQALTPTSPAVDTGGGTCPATDERGIVRPQDGNEDTTFACDIGAFELNPCLVVEKTCAVAPGAFTCTKPITSLQMQWEPGSMTDATKWDLTLPGTVIDVKVYNGPTDNKGKPGAGTTLVATQCGVKPGDIVEASGLSKADSYWVMYNHVAGCVAGVANQGTITGTLVGVSGFKTDCSDPGMNRAAACDQFEGDANKKPPTNLVNDWVLQGMTSSATTNRTLVCHPPAQQNCVVPPGGGTVTYSYVVTNHSAATVTGITLVDIDDKNNTVAQDGPFDLAKGASATFTSTATIITNTTNVVTVSGNGGACTATDTATVTTACLLGYPFASANPKTSIAFNESGVLRAFQPDFAGPGDTIRVFYNDEHALTLGVRSVVVKTTTGTSTTPFPFTTMTANTNPDSKANPSVGTTALTGDAAGIDLSGRPMFPALFITDLTILGETSKAGDWQFGGTAIPPHFVSGTWKGAVKTVDKTKSPTTTTITPDADPAKNNFVLGPGSDPVPAGLANEGYGAEVRWNVNDLRVNLTTGTASTNPADPALSDPALKGHTFRMQFMVHDGDQNKTGGDVGQACVNVAIP